MKEKLKTAMIIIAVFMSSFAIIKPTGIDRDHFHLKETIARQDAAILSLKLQIATIRKNM